MNKRILQIICFELLRRSTDIPLFKKINFQILSDKCPYSDIKFATVYEKRFFDIFLYYKSRTLYDWLRLVILFRIHVLRRFIWQFLNIPILILIYQIHKCFKFGKHMDPSASVQKRRFEQPHVRRVLFLNVSLGDFRFSKLVYYFWLLDLMRFMLNMLAQFLFSLRNRLRQISVVLLKIHRNVGLVELQQRHDVPLAEVIWEINSKGCRGYIKHVLFH